MEKRKFHLGTIFSCYQSKFVSPFGIKDLQDLYKFMLGFSPSCGEIIVEEFEEVKKNMSEELLKQFSWLKLTNYSTINPKTATDWLQQQIAVHGEYLEVEETGIQIDNTELLKKSIKKIAEKAIIIVLQKL